MRRVVTLPHSRRGSTRGFPRSTRRRVGWEEGPGTFVEGTSSGTSSNILGAGQQFVQDGLTVVRIHGTFELLLTAVGSARDGFHGALGIGIVTVAAFDAGVASIPMPLTEIEWGGWFFHQLFSLNANSATLDATNVLHFQFDTKAMRKSSTEEIVVMVLDLVEQGVATCAFRGASRMLLKLP